jgi:hypothetical protein
MRKTTTYFLFFVSDNGYLVLFFTMYQTAQVIANTTNVAQAETDSVKRRAPRSKTSMPRKTARITRGEYFVGVEEGDVALRVQRKRQAIPTTSQAARMLGWGVEP